MVDAPPMSLLAYAATFTAAALACLAGLGRLSVIDDDATRRGMAGLLVTSTLWAASHVVFLLAPVRGVRLAAYYGGLVVGFAAVGAWLYFCSAYTGRALHRNRTYRRVAVGVFVAVIAVKLTNPLHGRYLTATFRATPFPHLAIQHGLLHWLAMGLSYALAAVGGFMLLELFTLTEADTRPLVALLGLMALPLGFDFLGRTSPALVDMTYEPLGVAVFAVGVLFVASTRFQVVRLADDGDDPVVVIGEGGTVRDVNEAAIELFPTLADAVGDPLGDRLPVLADRLADDERVLELERDGETRYYLLSTNPFVVGGARHGRVVVVSNITREERYRQKIERQNERLGRLAGVISHDLRNPLNVATGHLELARSQRDDENLQAVADSLDRIQGLIESLLALAQKGLDIGERRPVSLAALAEASWSTVDTGDAELVVAGDLRFEADPDRLRQALENLFRNSAEHAGGDAVVTVGPLAGDAGGFFVADDGPGVPPGRREEVLAFGESGGDGSGLGLAIIDTIAEAHGWTLTLTDADGGGARFEFVGIESADPDTGVARPGAERAADQSGSRQR
ncbi:histidine kinase [Halobacteriales archaeon QS_4_70_19]|nr:MAG: histidine kinase [Halobacteriales archaeon QS_4_70_19]